MTFTGVKVLECQGDTTVRIKKNLIEEKSCLAYMFIVIIKKKIYNIINI